MLVEREPATVMSGCSIRNNVWRRLPATVSARLDFAFNAAKDCRSAASDQAPLSIDFVGLTLEEKPGYLHLSTLQNCLRHTATIRHNRFPLYLYQHGI